MEKYYLNKKDDILKDLNSDQKNGLSSQEAKQRLEKYGPNALAEKKGKSFFAKLIEQLLDPMVIILLVAAAVSSLQGDMVETLIILAIVVLNSGLSLYQEGKAENSLKALQNMSAPHAKVIRDGRIQSVPAHDLVPGDIVSLETGDIVPADIRLLDSQNLSSDESSLTGESVPVDKDSNIELENDVEIGDRTNYLHSSSIITRGRGIGIVANTGHNTEIGKIATNIQSTEEEASPLQLKLAKLSKTLGYLVVGVSIIVFIVGLLRPDLSVLDSLMTAVSLAVAAIPEGLAAVVTIVLSIGMNRMSKKNAIVKKLLAVETLGTTTFIASDKTGTLTQNEMTVKTIFTNNQHFDVEGVGYSPEGDITSNEQKVNISENKELEVLITAASLDSDAKLKHENNKWDIIGDPTEGALITLSEKAGLSNETLNDEFKRVKEYPFDSTRKMMTTFHENYFDDKFVSFTKGAPDIMIDKSSKIILNGEVVDFTPELKQELLDKNNEYARQALRVLAFSYRTWDKLPEDKDPDNIESDMIFIGLTGMIDPARPEAKEAIKECKTAGIIPMMITGDYLETALAIGKDLGIADSDDQAIMGKELNNMTPEQLREIVKTKRVFARVSPENKVQIVTALKENGEITAMTGDGVNDAPAIKKADIGIAMGITGTDVAKGTAEVILTDDNFATIVNAVEEGRIIYANIKKFVSFLLTCNIGEVLIMLIAMVVGAPIPLTVIQLLWLNLVTDSFPALALGVEKGEPDIMNNPPRKTDEQIIDKTIIDNIIVQAIAITVSTLGAFYISLNYLHAGESGEIQLHAAQTVAFITLILAELLRAFSARSEKYTLFELGIFTNKSLVHAFIGSFILTLLVVYLPFVQDIFNSVPLRLIDWAVIIPFAFLPFVVGEIHKLIERKLN
ncbi:cation-translocating P-type ATPase [Helcococcus sueciensis]|uniref:cation-translocating P-type ATPase n=1 Tax=Helcococcus sueciensis TaxID=241555 RepID=UPI00040D4840|nr:cation-translocating P-type ATPase [Helcococcus sueciensis]